MAYQTTSFQMTQSNLKDHSTVAGFFKRFLHSCTAVDNTQGPSASRGPSSSAEPLVFVKLAGFIVVCGSN